MATYSKIILVDDVDGAEAAETVNFGLDGVHYEIDLSQQNAANLRKSIDGFVNHARKVGGRKKAAPLANDDPRDIRMWAQNNGFKVAQRGRVSKTVIDAYKTAEG